MESLCRLCLSEESDLEPIFDENDTNLLNKIIDFTSIEVKKNLLRKHKKNHFKNPTLSISDKIY